MPSNPAFLIGLVLGALMIVAVVYVYVKHRSFGLGGSCMSLLGVVLVGMSVWKSVDVSIDGKGMSARLDQVETIAKRAENSASQAQDIAGKTAQNVAGLQSTVQTALLQEKLKATGLYSAPVDGHMGAATQSALRRFQEMKGLPTTGILDDATKRAFAPTDP
ncbi:MULTISPECIES: peptidoglycan-binding domain-containing protein [Paraburkholderia]|uniref:peptidoglycan-binding domain-containing protein n=1 Tax=Paraburkholderia TaxID=1822464 RepID=UPI002AB6E0EE|nr:MULTISPECIES: peptidoglycan-binding domain-containing protein [Paraburkholderia]